MHLPDLLRIIHNADATCRNLELFDCHLADDGGAVSLVVLAENAAETVLSTKD